MTSPKRRVTYSRQALNLTAEISRRSRENGAEYFVNLRTSNGGAEVLRPADAYWIEYTRMTDGSQIHCSSVFADNPRDAVTWLNGHLQAVAWNFGRN